MRDFFFRKSGTAASLVLVIFLSGCAVPKAPSSKQAAKTAASAQATEQCQPAQAGDTLIGNWLSIHKRRGVAGELHMLFTLKPDGSMAYAEQLRRGKKPSTGLSETGCWRHEGQTLLLQTTKSNGVPVELSDPIYVNRYRIRAQTGKLLSLQRSDGAINARRMPDGYRMPY